MVKFFIYNKRETISLAKNIFNISDNNLIYGFIGNYGVGKTFFIKNMFSNSNNLISDSFIFLNYYFFNNKFLYHLDLSKISSYQDFFYFYSNFMLTNKAILCIEWIDKFYNCFDNYNKIVTVEIFFIEKNVRIFDIFSNNNFFNNKLLQIKSGMEQSGSLSGS